MERPKSESFVLPIKKLEQVEDCNTIEALQWLFEEH